MNIDSVDTHIPEKWPARVPPQLTPKRKLSFWQGVAAGAIGGAMLARLMLAPFLNPDVATIRARAFAAGEEHARQELAELMVATERIEQNKTMQALEREIATREPLRKPEPNPVDRPAFP